jgi:hypothetical protein
VVGWLVACCVEAGGGCWIEDLQRIMAVAEERSAGVDVPCAEMTGTCNASPTARPARVWNPIHWPVEEPMSSV